MRSVILTSMALALFLAGALSGADSCEAADLFGFPCIYQELDTNKLTNEVEYELSFKYKTGDTDNDLRMAETRVGLALCAKSDNPSRIESDEIILLCREKLSSPGKWSWAKVRFRLDGKASSEGGVAGANDLVKAKKVILFLGASRKKEDMPAIRYDNVEIDPVE